MRNSDEKYERTAGAASPLQDDKIQQELEALNTIYYF